MAKHWRILGLSLLALIGVLAVNASAAQAKWLILKELKPGTVSSVNEVKLEGTGEPGYLLSESGSKIFCNKSTGNATVTLNETKTEASGKATVTFKECVDKAFPTCTVHSKEAAGGTIVASGSGKGEMTGEEVYSKVTGPGNEFTTIFYLGEECPFNEAEEIVSGTVKVTLLDPLKLAALHKVDILGEGLKLGENPAKLHMLDAENKELDVLLGSVTEIEGKPVAVHLCELPGAPAC